MTGYLIQALAGLTVIAVLLLIFSARAVLILGGVIVICLITVIGNASRKQSTRTNQT